VVIKIPPGLDLYLPIPEDNPLTPAKFANVVGIVSPRGTMVAESVSSSPARMRKRA